MQNGTMSKNRIHTWADGFGRWYAAVPGDYANPRAAARRAIRKELAARGEIQVLSHPTRLEEAPDHWLTTDRATRPVFREAL